VLLVLCSSGYFWSILPHPPSLRAVSYWSRTVQGGRSTLRALVRSLPACRVGRPRAGGPSGALKPTANRCWVNGPWAGCLVLGRAALPGAQRCGERPSLGQGGTCRLHSQRGRKTRPGSASLIGTWPALPGTGQCVSGHVGRGKMAGALVGGQARSSKRRRKVAEEAGCACGADGPQAGAGRVGRAGNGSGRRREKRQGRGQAARGEKALWTGWTPIYLPMLGGQGGGSRCDPRRL